MKTPFKYFILSFFAVLFVSLTSCKKEEPVDPNTGKPTIENLVLDPAGDLKYGDNVKVSAKITDEIGLRTYTIQMSNSGGTIYEKTEMLTGKTFDLNLDIPIPLPKNAVAGNMTVSLSVKNSGNQIASSEKVINNLALPTFDKLYLVIGNMAYAMVKNGNTYEFEDFISAEAKGRIYTNPDKTGLFWGMEKDEIIALGSSDITVGKETEEYFKISFNPISFVLTLGNPQAWNPISESLYIYGGISGNWQDGEITTQINSAKMSGFSLGNRKMWSWTPPATETNAPGEDMYGAIVGGKFRFKKEGIEQYITYANKQIVTGTDNKDNSFVITDGGAYTIKVFSDGNVFNKIRLEDGSKTLEYKNEGIFIDGVLSPSSITFANSTLTLCEGSFFEFEGNLKLTKGQNITAQGINLRVAYCEPDVYTGKGNLSWTMIQETSDYYVKIDPFSRNIYTRNIVGYPQAIYMDGWSWKKHPEDPKGDWEPASMLCLYRVGTSNIYEAQLYIYPWGGDVKFFAAPPLSLDYDKMHIFSKYFDGVTAAGTGMLLPSVEGNYKVSVDLKDGFTWNKEQMEDTSFQLIPTNSKKFTIKFTAL